MLWIPGSRVAAWSDLVSFQVRLKMRTSWGRWRPEWLGSPKNSTSLPKWSRIRATRVSFPSRHEAPICNLRLETKNNVLLLFRKIGVGWFGEDDWSTAEGKRRQAQWGGIKPTINGAVTGNSAKVCYAIMLPVGVNDKTLSRLWTGQSSDFTAGDKTGRTYLEKLKNKNMI